MAVRLDIQGLRSVAVGIVVVYHLWPWHLTGGYVGVDVFFVISGYLITAHLVREVDESGRIRLAQFWARRARRLLPASLFVLLAVLAITAVSVPRTLWTQFSREVVASTVYVQNWALAVDSVDYLAAENLASPVQHYWTLSLEEQFYVLWPLLIATVLLVSRNSRWRRPAIALAIAVLTAVSFVTSIVWTASSGQQAYFVTPTRVWEFGAGALLAFAPSATRWAMSRSVAAWCGLGLIVAAAIAFDGATPFPGSWALVPVVGTVLVIWTDTDQLRGSPSSILRAWPFQFTGEISYAIYLWHWVLIVLSPYVLGRSIFAQDKIIIAVVTAILSYLTWRYIENPIRRWSWLSSRRPRTTFGLSACGMALVMAIAFSMARDVAADVDESLARAQHLLSSPSACIGASAADPLVDCDSTLGPGEVVPLPAAAREDSPEDCLVDQGSTEFSFCEFGVPRDQSRGTIALIGDSHANHWLPAFEEIANQYGWHGIAATRASCPFTPARRTLDSAVLERCADFNAEVFAELDIRQDVAVVVMSAYSDVYFDAPAGVEEREFARESYREAIETLPSHVGSVYIIRDSPKPQEDNVQCVEMEVQRGRLDPGVDCGVPGDRGLVRDVLAEAGEASPRSHVVDFSSLYCPDAICLPVVGGVMVYADHSHLTSTWVRSAETLLLREMAELDSDS